MFSFAFQCNADVASFGMPGGVLVVANVACLGGEDGVVFSDADVFAGMPFRPCAKMGSLVSYKNGQSVLAQILPLCLKMILPGITYCDAVFFAPRRRPAESPGPLARPWDAWEACRTKMAGDNLACLGQRLSAFNDAARDARGESMAADRQRIRGCSMSGQWFRCRTGGCSKNFELGAFLSAKSALTESRNVRGQLSYRDLIEYRQPRYLYQLAITAPPIHLYVLWCWSWHHPGLSFSCFNQRPPCSWASPHRPRDCPVLAGLHRLRRKSRRRQKESLHQRSWRRNTREIWRGRKRFKTRVPVVSPSSELQCTT